ncbi:hypothetical protein BP6252_13742 [Coleophoma cylindrospora]|uniref:Zn(2)-C6 fungal-type domain-containing protein n=1 Tax=Coleophoma cylindrospora TaxID=1849047 RepID=A0A3D8Q6M2_9HELO|nr:hypothetical protein BP6252_13742 [Coleophoma cylindrospora]
MRVAKACRQCRSSKRKCIRSDSYGPCVQCSKRQIPCSGKLKPIRAAQLLPCHVESPNAQDDDDDGANLPEDTVIELVEHYISKIHDRPHSLFHLPTLRTSVRKGALNKALLLAICAMGSRFSASAEIRKLEHQLTEKSKRLLLADLENICLETIQTCVLVANLCAAIGNSSSEALFFRISIGMAQIMRLPLVDPGDTVVMGELKRRIWWTLYMADRWYSSGLDLPRQINESERSTELPMEESTFRDLPIDQLALDTPWKPGLWAYMITLVDVFGPIQDLNHRIVQEHVEDEEIDRCAYDLSRKLDAWERSLPADIILNEENLQLHKQKSNGGPFVALHLGFHHYSTLLYFQYLESKGTSTSTTKMFAERCKYHASSYSALLKFARENEGFKAVYPTVGHMAIVSSSVLLHTLLFGDEDKISSARNSLNANFEALVELEHYWPSLKSMV